MLFKKLIFFYCSNKMEETLINCGGKYIGFNKKLCNLKNCKNCYDHSFASHLKSKEWSI